MKKGNILLILCLMIILILGFGFVKEKIITKENPYENIRPVAFDKGGLPSFSNLIKAIKPCVVNISTTMTIKGPGFTDPFTGPYSPFRDFFGNDFFERFFGDLPKREFKQRSLGSGFIIDKDGYILTNNHVVEKATSIKVKLSDGKEYDAKVIGKDAKTDIALIKINARHDLPVAKLGDSDRLEVGDWVIAIGNPFGLEHTITAGIVSAKGRVIGAGPYDDFIQTDASINPGNSGGPLFNINGEVIGINTAIVATGQGIGFAIPINMAKDMLHSLKTKGKVVRGSLGVRIQEVTPEIAKNFGLKEPQGALVADVIEGSPADKAGIKSGDIIVSYNGKDIKNRDVLPKLVAATEVGKKVKVGIIRDGKRIDLEVVVGELQDETIVASKKPDVEKDFGLVVQNITPEIARHLKLKDTRGVIVTEVQPDSPANNADIREGDIIIKIGKKTIRNVNDFKEALKKANIKEGIVIFLRRENITFYTVLREE